jgi:hypothetical protein
MSDPNLESASVTRSKTRTEVCLTTDGAGRLDFIVGSVGGKPKLIHATHSEDYKGCPKSAGS